MPKNIMLYMMFLLSFSVFSQENLEEVKITKKQKGIKNPIALQPIRL